MFNLVRITIRRAREQRLAQVAGSLTFTTLLSIVPLVAVSFALFTRLPAFKQLEQAIEQYLLKSMLPQDISRTVLKHLNHFAANASSLTWVGSVFVLATAIAMLLTVENTLNGIWEVRKARPFLKRVGLYLLVLAVGPAVVGASLWAMSWVLGASMGVISALPAELKFVLDLGPLVVGTVGLATLFYFVPNARVRRRDAFAGGLFGGLAVELGKRVFAAYLLKVPTYKAVYGAFAVFPIFLLWVYFSWLVTLTAALVAANLGRTTRRTGSKAPQTRAASRRRQGAASDRAG